MTLATFQVLHGHLWHEVTQTGQFRVTEPFHQDALLWVARLVTSVKVEMMSLYTWASPCPPGDEFRLPRAQRHTHRSIPLWPRKMGFVALSAPPLLCSAHDPWGKDLFFSGYLLPSPDFIQKTDFTKHLAASLSSEQRLCISMSVLLPVLSHTPLHAGFFQRRTLILIFLRSSIRRT